MTDSSLIVSGRSIAVLEMIAAGSSYEQILSAYPDLSYLDIFRAAEQALDLTSQRLATAPKAPVTLEEKRKRHQRAYEPWSDEEDQTLGNLVRSGMTVARIAGELQRNRGAIQSRLKKQGLVSQLTPREQERFKRIDGF